MGENKKYNSGFALERLEAVLGAFCFIEKELNLPLALILVIIARYPGLSVNDLAQCINVPQQTTSRYIATLQGRYQMPGSNPNVPIQPLLTLEISTDDPRRRALFITPAGKTKVKRILDELYT